MTEKKQSEVLRDLVKTLRTRPVSLAEAIPKLQHAADEIDRLHALCEEQKRLLEQARYVLKRAKNQLDYECFRDEPKSSALEAVYFEIRAITNHLRQHEGEKHD